MTAPRRRSRTTAAMRIPPRAAGTKRRGTRRFVIVTGMSGSGKTHAIRALEDLGYFCIDNLPTMLIPTMAELATRADAGLEKVAIVVDAEDGARHGPPLYRPTRGSCLSDDRHLLGSQSARRLSR